jgi:hypothetical protein
MKREIETLEDTLFLFLSFSLSQKGARHQHRAAGGRPNNERVWSARRHDNNAIIVSLLSRGKKKKKTNLILVSRVEIF